MTWLLWFVALWLLLTPAVAVYVGAVIRRADRRAKASVDEGADRHTGSYDFCPPARLPVSRAAPPDRWTPPPARDGQDTPGMSSAG